jgi:hypothetical protein
MEVGRLAEILNAAYLTVHGSKFYVGVSGAMAGVSLIIFVRLFLGIFNVYSKRMSDRIATLEAFLLAALAVEVMTISRATWLKGVPLVQAVKFKPFGFDVLVVLSGSIFLTFHVFTSLTFLPFLLNLIWIFPLTARSAFYFRMAWQRATTHTGAALPTNASLRPDPQSTSL